MSLQLPVASLESCRVSIRPLEDRSGRRPGAGPKRHGAGSRRDRRLPRWCCSGRETNC